MSSMRVLALLSGAACVTAAMTREDVTPESVQPIVRHSLDLIVDAGAAVLAVGATLLAKALLSPEPPKKKRPIGLTQAVIESASELKEEKPQQAFNPQERLPYIASLDFKPGNGKKAHQMRRKQGISKKTMEERNEGRSDIQTLFGEKNCVFKRSLQAMTVPAAMSTHRRPGLKK